MSRFKVKFEALKDSRVAYLEFPYVEPLDSFLSGIRQIDPERSSAGFASEEHPPFERLNRALLATGPGLICAFKQTSPYAQRWKQSGIWEKKRHILALSTLGDSATLWRPSVEQINDLVAVWALQWAKTRFAKTLEKRGGDRLVSDLVQAIQGTAATWQEVSAGDLWENQTGRDFVWDTLPSLLAAQFIYYWQDKTFFMGESQPIAWRLAQGSNGRLSVVSEPFTHAGKDTLSYALDFSVQTQVKRALPWIALHIRLHRWANRPVVGKNVRTKVGVMISVATARKPGWKVTPTLVRLDVGGRIKGDHLQWNEDVSALLDAWRARALVDPNRLFADPQAYNLSRSSSDGYLILHAEGMTYKGDDEKRDSGHGGKSGTSLRERSDLMQGVINALDSYLIPDDPLEVEPGSVLTQKMRLEKRLYALYSVKDMKANDAHYVAPKLNKEQQRRRIRREATDTGLNRATNGKPIHILIATKDEKTFDWLKEAVEDALFIEQGSKLPQAITITHVPVTFEMSALIQLDETEKKATEFAAKWQQKVQEWQQELRGFIASDGHNLALIEMDGDSNNLTNAHEWQKSAVRNACVKLGIHSQMCMTLPSNFGILPQHTMERMRIRSAVRDLLIRQTGLLYGEPAKVYRHAGLDEDRAGALVVVGLYRMRKSARQRVDYAVAVELHPDGSVKVVLPDTEGNPTTPVSYLDAAIKVGQLMGREPNSEMKHSINLNMNSESGQPEGRVARFAESIIGQSRNCPTLILLEADGWREEHVKLTGDKQIEKDTIIIRSQSHTPQTLPNVALLRVRESGTRSETPQYVSGSDVQSWNELDQLANNQEMIGMIDTNAESSIMHYFSIGRQPVAFGKDQDEERYAFEDGGDVAFKHQQAIEYVPFFAANEDDRLIYCRIAHFLRSSPAWDGGNINLPYPLHLAQTLIDDAIDAIRPSR